MIRAGTSRLGRHVPGSAPAWRTSRRSVVTREVLLLALAVALLVLAFFVYRWLARQSTAPSDRYIPFRCANCAYEFELSHAQLDERIERHQFRTAPDGGARFRCEKCGQFAARRVEQALPPPTSATPSATAP